jgi:hypothetical protein
LRRRARTTTGNRPERPSVPQYENGRDGNFIQSASFSATSFWSEESDRTKEKPMTTTPHSHYEHAAGIMAGGSATEALVGIGAVVLTIIGLAGVVPHLMLSIAVIAVGAALLIEGAAIAAEYSQAAREVGGGRAASVELGGGTAIEFLGGAAGVVLGILALIGVVPVMLNAIAAIVFGATLVLSTGGVSRLGDIGPDYTTAERAARGAVTGGVGVQALVGLGAIALGIIGLVGYNTQILTLVAVLAVGAALLITGTGSPPG